MCKRSRLLLALWLLVSARSYPAGKPPQLAIVNVTVIAMHTSTPQPASTVLIEGERIIGVGPTKAAQLQPGTRRIDGTGKFLIPGLVDAHVHLPASQTLSQAMCNLLVSNGVTTVFNLSGSELHLDLRSKTRRSERTGPAIYTSGPPLGDIHGGQLLTSAGDIEREVVTQKQAGYDMIKLHGDLSRDAYRRLVTVARRQSIPLVGHAPRNLGLGPMIEERQQAVAHIEEYLYAHFYFRSDMQKPVEDLTAKVRFLAEKTAASETSVISTLAVFRDIASQVENLDSVLARSDVRLMPRALGEMWRWWPPHNSYVARFDRETVPWFRRQYAILAQVAAALQKQGVRLLAGTDTPTPVMVPGFSLHQELQALVDAGLSPYEALRTATVNPAAFLKLDSGTIAPGKRADLVLLKRNPLDDISNTAEIEGVVLRGVWMPRQHRTVVHRSRAAGFQAGISEIQPSQPN